MAATESIQQLKTWLGETSLTDERLELFLSAAENYILNYCRRDDLPDRLEMAMLEIAAIMCNKAGSEGVQSQSEGGVSVTFTPTDADIPKSLRDQMNSFRKVGVVSAASEAMET